LRSERQWAGSKHAYAIGDGVFWATASTAGTWTFIGHPRGDRTGRVLVLASSPEIGFEIEADQCSPAGWSDPQRGREYRQRCFRSNPRGLKGNP
jgi:hypothetical protein